MHELSVANHIVETALEHAHVAGVTRVTRVNLRVGALSCVNRRTLESCFPFACEGTVADGAELAIVEIPVSVYCPQCQETRELSDVQPLECPSCGLPTGDIRHGNELEIESIEVID